MNTKDFYYDLPERLIAQTPIEPRDHARLLFLPKNGGEIEHRHFYEITGYLHPGDTLIINDSKVLPARIFGKKETGANVEILLLKNKGDDIWEALVRPGGKVKPGTCVLINDEVSCTVNDILDDGVRNVRFEYDHSQTIYEILEKIGTMPLPPYIKEKLRDQSRYQTVYANETGSAAAPTAGLHFTNYLLSRIKDMGVDIGRVTLHVGLGTFRPVKAAKIEDHKMHSEHYHVPEETIELIRRTRARGGRVISVGTTGTRTLESAFDMNGNCIRPTGDTDIFIYPGYKFKVIDGLITNFHLPESTLVMLVAALVGRERILNAYKTAVDAEYRFFSFGDAMLIL